MTQAPTETPTTSGYEPPRNVQFSVFLHNRVGGMLELLKALRAEALTVAGFSILDSTGHAVVRVLTSRSELARRLLQRHNLPFSEADVLCVELYDEPQLPLIFDPLLHAELNLHYAYALLVRPRGRPIVACCCDDVVLAGQIIRKRGFTLMGENDLGENATGGAEGMP
ncbi:MAG: acetolactate synthase [Planctomycetota bacterium]